MREGSRRQKDRSLFRALSTHINNESASEGWSRTLSLSQKPPRRKNGREGLSSICGRGSGAETCRRGSGAETANPASRRPIFPHAALVGGAISQFAKNHYRLGPGFVIEAVVRRIRPIQPVLASRIPDVFRGIQIIPPAGGFDLLLRVLVASRIFLLSSVFQFLDFASRGDWACDMQHQASPPVSAPLTFPPGRNQNPFLRR